MTKRDLIEEVARLYPRFSRQEAEREAEIVVNAFFDVLTDALARGERIEVRGFGAFDIKQRLARERRNPRTGAKVSLEANKTPFFKAAKELRLRVDGKGPPGHNLARARRGSMPASS